ncbi:hypothetical protein [Adonisia turfae]
MATIALTLIATKATEKVGEKLGEGAITSARQLLAVLQQKSPETAMRLAAASDSDVIDAEIIEEVKQAAAVSPEVQAAVDKTAQAMNQEFGTVKDSSKLADKIGVIVQPGGVYNQTGNMIF